jgi:hypothetical protein
MEYEAIKSIKNAAMPLGVVSASLGTTFTTAVPGLQLDMASHFGWFAHFAALKRMMTVVPFMT